MIVDVIIPALDEERTLPPLLEELRAQKVRRVIVVDNGSRDRTAKVARAAGAVVVEERRRGYGAACLRGIAECARQPPDAIAFMDADGSDDPAELPSLIEPLARGEADFVLGSRVLAGSRVEPGALSPQARAGNLIATTMIRALYGARFTDLGPYRALRWEALQALEMRDLDWGWTAEMQVKAVRKKLRVREVPVSWRRRRAGKSKISGTVRGVIGAGYKILTTIARYAR